MKFRTARVHVAHPAFVAGLLAFAVLFLQVPARAADSAGAKLYASKCVACHGDDGAANTPVGKALKIRSLLDPAVQKMTDEQLTTIIDKGKDKMPAYGKTLKPDQIKSLVAYVRELAKKKK